MEHNEELTDVVGKIIQNSSVEELTIFLKNVYNQTQDGSSLDSLTVAKAVDILEMTKSTVMKKTQEGLKTILTGLKPHIEKKIEAGMEPAIMKIMRQLKDSGFYSQVRKQ